MQIFITNVNSTIDKHAPIKFTWKKHQVSNKPWITTGIPKSISTKNTLYKKFLKAKDPDSKKLKHENFIETYSQKF